MFKKPLLLVNIERDNSTNAIDDVYLQLIKYEVAKLISYSDLVSTINSIKSGEVWNNNSQKHKEFLKFYCDLENLIEFEKLIE